RDIPYIIAHNKADLLEETPDCPDNEIYVSAKDKQNIYELKEMIGRLSKDCTEEKVIASDLIEKGETAVLVIPIDAAAPKGRLILPQQQTIRDILEKGGLVTVCRDTELKQALSSLSEKPKIVITDSQAFGRVSRDTPEDILLTSFSILFARYKGDLEEAVRGAARLKDLKDGDKVLISEGCTHHRQCGDIGTVKLPKWVREYTGKNIEFSFTSGGEFPDDPSEYALVIHCGGCMLNEREMKSRIGRCKAAGVPVTNYGIAIAELHGILKRSLSPFPDIMKILD
ncbi:MAG: [FeFe] hydrogenase H-cluster maturation GTPase HydF, partial [Ruminiclostridium sp.]